MFYDENAEKFQPRGRKGLIYEYAQLGAFRILDMDEYVNGKGVVRIITTRDCKIQPLIFPFVVLARDYPNHDSWTFTMRGVGNADLDYRIDFLGRVRCARPDCGKLIIDAPISCRMCLRNERHGRGRPGPGCRNARCPGHASAQEEDDVVITETVMQTVDAPAAPRSPRWRMLSKAPSDIVVTPPQSRPGSRPASPRSGGQDVTMEVSPEGDPVGPTTTAEASADSPSINVPIPFLSAAKKPSGTPQKAFHDARDAKEKIFDARKAQKDFEKMYMQRERDVMDLRREVGYAFGLVTRVVRATSEEAANTPKAVEAMQKEINNLLDKRALDVAEIMEYDEVARNYDNAEFVRGNLLLGVQNSELDPSNHRWKARFVALGDNVFSAWGERIWEDVIQTTPVGLPEVRLAFTHQALFPQDGGRHGDVDGAYLTTEMAGKPKFLILPKSLWVILPDKKKNMRRPCIRIRKALYGLKRAGADFGEKARRTLISLGYEEIRDVTASVFVKWPIMLIAYSDDHYFSGPKDIVDREFDVLDKTFGYSKKTGEAKGSADIYFVGISRQHVACDAEGTITFALHQTPYCSMVCDKYMKHKKITALRSIMTPMEESEEHHNDDDEDGADASVAREYVGCLLYIARGTRGDLSFAVARLGRGVAHWTKRHDRMLERVMRYLWSTREYALVGRANHRDFANLHLRCWFDADHAGDPAHSKSVTGYALWICGPSTSMLIDWCSRLQTSTGKSTPEVELVAGADALTRCAWPIQQVVSEVYRYDVPLSLGTDNSTTKLDIEIGFSKGMRHLKKHQRISLGLLSEALERDDASLDKLPSKDNTSDIFTKPLGSHLFYTHRDGLGIARL